MALNYREIGHRLRVLGLTERELARAANVTVHTYRKWENAGQKPRGPALVDICVKYDVSVDWLIMGEAANLGAHLTRRTRAKSQSCQLLGPFGRKVLARKNPPSPRRTPPGAA
jgi:transcriptional regulator with XRE-family HTH domain